MTQTEAPGTDPRATHPASEPTSESGLPQGFVLALAVLALVVATSTWWSGAADMVVTPDSGSYLSTAQNLADGKGVTSSFPAETTRYPIDQQVRFDEQVPFTEWPPLYPVALGVIMATGATAPAAAQVLNAAALAVTAVLCSLATWRLTRSRLLVLLVVPWLVLIGPVLSTMIPLPSVNVIGQSVFVLSETIYLPLFLAAVLVGSEAGRSSRRVLVAALVLIAAATLTRFVGVAAGVGAAVAVASGAATTARRRADTGRAVPTGRAPYLRGPYLRTSYLRAIALLAAGPAALVLWSLLRALLWGSGEGEQVAWHPPGTTQLGDLVDVVGSWFLVQPSWPTPLRVLLVAVVGLVLVYVALVPRWRVAVGGPRYRTGEPAGDLTVALVVAALVHVAVVLATVTFLDANLPLTQRTVLPVQAVAYLVAAGLAVSWIERRPSPRDRLVGGAVAACVTIALLVPGVDWLTTRSDPDVPARIELLQAVQEQAAEVVGRVPTNITIVTNQPGLVWFESDSPILLAPRRIEMLTHEVNPHLVEDLRSVGELLRSRSAVVILYPDVLDGGTVHEGLEEHAGLVRLEDCGAGAELFVTPETVTRFRSALSC